MPEKELRHIEDPKWLVYDQIQRVLKSRAEGKGALESLYGLLALLSPYTKDDPVYQAAMTDLLKAMEDGQTVDVTFWKWFDAAVQLAAFKGWWLAEEGSE